MEQVGVWSEDTSLSLRLAERTGNRFRFLPGSHPADFAKQPLALLIITPSARSLAGAGLLRPRLALIPGENVALARRVLAQSAVSYGLGGQNTLTLSSLEDGAVSLALQRELYTLSGALVDRQEWVLPFSPDGPESPEEFLCRAGALLLLDQKL